MALPAVCSNLFQGLLVPFHTDHNYPRLIADRLERITNNLDPHEGQPEGYIPEEIIWRISLVYRIYSQTRNFITLCPPVEIKEILNTLLREKAVGLKSREPKYTILSPTDRSNPATKKELYTTFFNALLLFPDQTTDHPELVKLLNRRVLLGLEYYPPPGKPLLLPSTRFMSFLLRDMYLHPERYANEADKDDFHSKLHAQVSTAAWAFSGPNTVDVQ